MGQVTTKRSVYVWPENLWSPVLPWLSLARNNHEGFTGHYVNYQGDCRDCNWRVTVVVSGGQS